ncbi:protein cramped-like isoform X3 [Arvicola amphibius]|uniref:protein cramped-like isoform X3 n=1 Tax=Arvicola amphibius TaxID=1047088 RepID=UPI0018E3D76E|nr:protein cramped-like isoform X3 [Arvicola amphibius]
MSCGAEGMTVKLGDAGSGEEGLKKLGKRTADEESLDGEGPGGADAAEDSSSTKRDGQTPRAAGAPAPPRGLPAPSPPQGSPQDQHHFLRSSVRPQSKRPRKDAPCAVGSGGASGSGPRGKGGDGGASSSGNISVVATATPAGGSRSSSRNLGSSGPEKEEGKKVRRQWESWSTEDKNTFFEGLYEHGKDFEAIQNNIALKYKKKGKPASMVKNKEQVRHFYYRTWHKITKYIDFDNVFSRGLKKSSQELYGLICYGELRKKIGGCMDDKNATKLNELIQVGATTVRYKGRNLRIKAPMCRALKKLCDPDGLSDEEDQKPVRLPLKVPVELQPRNNHAWARVQSLAQNPRLRMIVELHRKVSSLIEFLKQKWALHEVRISCQDLIIPEQCRCTDTQSGREHPLLGMVASPEALMPSSREVADSSPPGPDPQTGTDPQLDPRLLPDICTKELADASPEESQEKGSPSEPLLSQGQPAVRPSKEVPASQLAQQLREEGWNLQTSESLTLAEVYLMMGKPSKLQLEYDWLAVLGPESQVPTAQGQTALPRSPPSTLHQQRLLNCLLRLISTEVHPKMAFEANTASAASVRPTQEEQSTSPPGKVVTISSRSPRCSRNPSALRSNKTFPSGSAPCSPGLRNPPRPLLVAGSSNTGSGDSDGGLFAVPTTLPPNSRHGKLFSPSKEAELTFRQHLDSISIQSDFFSPKPKKLRKRHLRKPLVVQRTLLPRPSENQSHNVCSFSILSNSPIAGRGWFRPIQSSLTKAALSRPIVPKVLPSQATSHLPSAIDLAAQSAGIIPGSPLPVLDTDGSSGISPLTSEQVTTAISGQGDTGPHQNREPVTSVGGTSDPFISVPRPEQEPMTDSFQGSSVLSLPELPKTHLQNGLSTPLPSSESSSTRLSPPNVSALLDISLPGPPEDVLSQGEPATQISDSIIEIAISSGQYGEGVPLSPAKLNGSDSSKSLPSPSSSPQPNWIASPTHDPQWYPSDSTDSSLNSLFASFISPEKSKKMLPTTAVGANSGTSLLGPSLLDGNSRDSFVSRSLADVAEVVDSQLVCMMNENSIDYISRFNDLAQELSINEPGRREVLFDGGGGSNPVGDLSQ